MKADLIKNQNQVTVTNMKSSPAQSSPTHIEGIFMANLFQFFYSHYLHITELQLVLLNLLSQTLKSFTESHYEKLNNI